MSKEWKNARSDKPPKDKQNVIISVNGIYYDAIYEAKQHVFSAKNFGMLQFSPDKFTIYWCELGPPDPNQ